MACRNRIILVIKKDEKYRIAQKGKVILILINTFFLELEVLLFQSPVFLSLKIFLLACLQYGLGSLQLLLKTKEIPDPQEKDGVISFTASSNLWNLQ